MKSSNRAMSSHVIEHNMAFIVNFAAFLSISVILIILAYDFHVASLI